MAPRKLRREPALARPLPTPKSCVLSRYWRDHAPADQARLRAFPARATRPMQGPSEPRPTGSGVQGAASQRQVHRSLTLAAPIRSSCGLERVEFGDATIAKG